MFNDEQNLHNYAKMSLPDRVVDVVDPILRREVEQASADASCKKNYIGAHKILQCLTTIIKVGLACSAELPKERMDISTVVAELQGIRDILLGTRRHGIGQHEIMIPLPEGV
ncbi:unnamed protein product [Dovyalis caffra]|uniref:Uncharacterized protein n=1 Tax=Dovyalis caffra TaxID=77055 RepID=A0AAV1QXN5_9ROSI|nr:unnamed protein product [Dovyalis caffra]